MIAVELIIAVGWGVAIGVLIERIRQRRNT